MARFLEMNWNEYGYRVSGQRKEQPVHSGATLASIGATRIHLLAFFLAATVVSGTWNWVYNAVNKRNGVRYRCLRPLEDGSGCCGAPARREASVNVKNGSDRTRYICKQGHRCAEAEFQPVAKGPVSRSIFMCSLVFFLGLLYS